MKKPLSVFVSIMIVALQLAPVNVSGANKFLATPSNIEEINIKLSDNLSQNIMGKLTDIENGIKSKEINRFAEYLEEIQKIGTLVNYDPELRKDTKLFRRILYKRSDVALQIADMLFDEPSLFISGQVDKILNDLVSSSSSGMAEYIVEMVKKGKLTNAQGTNNLGTATKNLAEWLDPANELPRYIRKGIYRSIIESRYGDILYAYGFGWKEFGTAGIRNQAVQSEFKSLLEKELNEFAENPNAPILTGPNLINSATLLQVATALINIMKDYKAKLDQSIRYTSLEEIAGWHDIDPEFARNILDQTITIAYDSRLNGKYFAHLLAAAFLKQGIKINLFDAPAGVPAGAAAAKGPLFFGKLALGKEFGNINGSAFGILISASHSEAECNGFKAFLGYQKSQVDAKTKNMIVDARDRVSYKDMQLELDGGKLEDFEKVFEKHKTQLTWLGSAEKIKGHNYCGAKFVPFYPLYFEYLSRRSPVPVDTMSAEQREKFKKAKEELKILYTAFFGVGAVPAANLPGFFNMVGYENVNIVNEQTNIMNGKFPGHDMPDPGVVEGWMSNLWDFILQEAGEDFARIDKAIIRLNELDLGAATDPDADRAGLMLSLGDGVRGNIKDQFLQWVEKNNKLVGYDEHKKRLIVTALNKIKDKYLMTANDAWTMLAYYKLAFMEENGTLSKDKVYTILKSHVTTDGLESVAQYFRDKGYHVYVVNTYVGFTQLAKKNRDLFVIAKQAWEIKNEIEQKGLCSTDSLNRLLNSYQTLKSNVPYENAGMPIIDEAIKYLRTGDMKEAVTLLNVIAHMENLVACEESNGYGEMGEYVPETDEVINAHISEKDGGLALYEFYELAAYGKAIYNKSAYDLFVDMVSNIGYTATDNQFLKYKGLSGVQEKTDTIEGFEKIFAVLIEKLLQSGRKVTLFNGKYTVEKVNIFRNKQYDVSYSGFPEEGVSLLLRTKSGSKAITTFRPSGTGDTNRGYNWILGEKPESNVDAGVYITAIRAELEDLRRDFFGVPGQEAGYVQLAKQEFHGLLTALKEAGKKGQLDIFKKVIDQDVDLSAEELKMLESVSEFVFAARDQKFNSMNDQQKWEKLDELFDSIDKNFKAWDEFFKSIKPGSKITDCAWIIKPWMGGYAFYAAQNLFYRGLKAEAYENILDDEEILNEVRFSFEKLQTMRNMMSELEKKDAIEVADQLHKPLAAKDSQAAERFLKGGYGQDGYGVPEGASVDGSFTLAGSQGYFLGLGKAFNETAANMREFLYDRARRIGKPKPIKLIIKPGIGGQHTPFQAIAEVFNIHKGDVAKITGEYELGKNYEESINRMLEEAGATWDQILLVPSSKSGSTDETMMIFSEIFYLMLKNIAKMEGIEEAEVFADIVFDSMHNINFINGNERPGKDLFKGFNLSLVEENAKKAGLELNYTKIRSVFGKVLGNMFFETTDRVDQSRLSAFVRNSGLDKELKGDAPGFGPMFDNVGGRWTADLHMSLFLAVWGIKYMGSFEYIIKDYWGIRFWGLMDLRSETRSKRRAYEIGNLIADERITDIALVVPSQLWWFGKAIEQNFNESIWQEGFANLICIDRSRWEAQSSYYKDRPGRLIINLSTAGLEHEAGNVLELAEDYVSLTDMNSSLLTFAHLYSFFYGVTNTVGRRLIVRAIRSAGLDPATLDINDLDNPATKILQQNLFLRQPYVELGKNLLEGFLGGLQKTEKRKPGTILKMEEYVKNQAREGEIKTNIKEIELPGSVKGYEQMISSLYQISEYAKQEGRKVVPIIYMEGERFEVLRNHLIDLGYEWIMQGTADQHINIQQLLAQPGGFLPVIISFVPEKFQPARRAIGFAKGYLDNISPNLARDSFAEATYLAFTTRRSEQGGRAVFMRIQDNDRKRIMLLMAMSVISEISAGRASETVMQQMKKIKKTNTSL